LKNKYAMALIAACGAAACAGGQTAQEPIYELRATEAPLRYDVSGRQTTVIELPTGGEQQIESETAATVAVSYGQRTGSGLPFELTFEALEVTGPGGSPDLSRLIGKPIRGTIDESGDVQIDEAPDVQVPGADAEGLASQTLGLLFVPLPPDGNPSAESWPLERSRAPGGGMDGTSTFEGTARFTPEMEWQGMHARIIVSEGDLRQRATGTPPGAPSEVDVDFEGEATTTYAWDPARGVVLHVQQDIELEGTIAMQGMALPTTTTGRQTFDLLP